MAPKLGGTGVGGSKYTTYEPPFLDTSNHQWQASSSGPTGATAAPSTSGRSHQHRPLPSGSTRSASARSTREHVPSSLPASSDVLSDLAARLNASHGAAGGLALDDSGRTRRSTGAAAPAVELPSGHVHGHSSTRRAGADDPPDATADSKHLAHDRHAATRARLPPAPTLSQLFGAATATSSSGPELHAPALPIAAPSLPPSAIQQHTSQIHKLIAGLDFLEQHILRQDAAIEDVRKQVAAAAPARTRSPSDLSLRLHDVSELVAKLRSHLYKVERRTAGGEAGMQVLTNQVSQLVARVVVLEHGGGSGGGAPAITPADSPNFVSGPFAAAPGGPGSAGFAVGPDNRICSVNPLFLEERDDGREEEGWTGQRAAVDAASWAAMEQELGRRMERRMHEMMEGMLEQQLGGAMGRAAGAKEEEAVGERVARLEREVREARARADDAAAAVRQLVGQVQEAREDAAAAAEAAEKLGQQQCSATESADADAAAAVVVQERFERLQADVALLAGRVQQVAEQAEQQQQKWEQREQQQQQQWQLQEQLQRQADSPLAKTSDVRQLSGRVGEARSAVAELAGALSQVSSGLGASQSRLCAVEEQVQARARQQEAEVARLHALEQEQRATAAALDALQEETRALVTAAPHEGREQQMCAQTEALRRGLEDVCRDIGALRERVEGSCKAAAADAERVQALRGAVAAQGLALSRGLEGVERLRGEVRCVAAWMEGPAALQGCGDSGSGDTNGEDDTQRGGDQGQDWEQQQQGRLREEGPWDQQQQEQRKRAKRGVGPEGGDDEAAIWVADAGHVQQGGQRQEEEQQVTNPAGPASPPSSGPCPTLHRILLQHHCRLDELQQQLGRHEASAAAAAAAKAVAAAEAVAAAPGSHEVEALGSRVEGFGRVLQAMRNRIVAMQELVDGTQNAVQELHSLHVGALARVGALEGSCSAAAATQAEEVQEVKGEVTAAHVALAALQQGTCERVTGLEAEVQAGLRLSGELQAQLTTLQHACGVYAMRAQEADAQVHAVLRDLQSRVQGVEGRVGELGAQVQGVEGRVGKLGAQVEGVESRCGAHEGGVGGVSEARMQAAETVVEGLAAAVQQATEKACGAEKGVVEVEKESKGVVARVEASAARAQEAKVRAAGVEARVQGMEAAQRLAETQAQVVEGRVQRVEEEVGELAARLERAEASVQKAAASAAEEARGLEERMRSMEDDMSECGSKAASAAEEAVRAWGLAVKAEGRAEEVEETLRECCEGTVRAAVAAGEAQGAVRALEGRIQRAEERVEAGYGDAGRALEAAAQAQDGVQGMVARVQGVEGRVRECSGNAARAMEAAVAAQGAAQALEERVQGCHEGTARAAEAAAQAQEAARGLEDRVRVVESGVCACSGDAARVAEAAAQAQGMASQAKSRVEGVEEGLRECGGCAAKALEAAAQAQGLAAEAEGRVLAEVQERVRDAALALGCRVDEGEAKRTELSHKVSAIGQTLPVLTGQIKRIEQHAAGSQGRVLDSVQALMLALESLPLVHRVNSKNPFAGSSPTLLALEARLEALRSAAHACCRDLVEEWRSGCERA